MLFNLLFLLSTFLDAPLVEFPPRYSLSDICLSRTNYAYSHLSATLTIDSPLFRSCSFTPPLSTGDCKRFPLYRPSNCPFHSEFAYPLPHAPSLEFSHFPPILGTLFDVRTPYSAPLPNFFPERRRVLPSCPSDFGRFCARQTLCSIANSLCSISFFSLLSLFFFVSLSHGQPKRGYLLPLPANFMVSPPGRDFFLSPPSFVFQGFL